MSHGIKECDKVESRDQEWHGLAIVNPELSLENCHLRSWDYQPKAVLTEDGHKLALSVLGVNDGAMMDVLNDDGEPTGEKSPLIVGGAYNPRTFKPVLNVRLLELLTKAIEGFGLTLESCGTVFNRGRLFLSFGLAGANFQVNGQEYKAFLNVGNGNDKSSPLWLNTSNTKSVCNNTFTINMNSAGQIMSVKKTQFSDFKLAEMGKAIAAMLRSQKEFAKILTRLCKVECDEKTAREFFAGFLTPNPDVSLSTRAQGNIDRLVELFSHGAGNDGNDFNDCFQSITDFYTHEAASGKGDESAQWKNFVSSEFGAGKTAKMQAWEILTDEKLRKATIQVGRKVLKLTANEARK